MQIEILDEPELEFGSGQRHADLRFGISAYGPADLVLDGAPTSIRLGLVGPRDQLDGLRRWIDRRKRPIRAKDAKYPTVPGFPRLRSRYRALHQPHLHRPELQRTVGPDARSRQRTARRTGGPGNGQGIHRRAGSSR